MTLWAMLAWGQSTAELVKGTTEFESCLESASCSDRFYRFLSSSMAAQGFTFQGDGQLSSAVTTGRDGAFAGGMLTTFPLGPPPENLSGKVENTQYSPVLPRLFGGWTGPGPGDTRLGASASLLPPIPVQGASALILGAELSWSIPAGERLRFGPEATFTWTRARAPIVASKEQYEARDEFDNPDNLDPETYEAVCAPAKNGCVDTFTVANPGLAAAASYDVGAGFAPFAKLGLAWVEERLWVMYDDTTWRVAGLQPNASVGTTWERGHVALALGAGFALKPAAIDDQDRAGAFWELQGSAAWRFGPARRDE